MYVLRGTEQSRAVARRQTELEIVNASIESQVQERTRELAASREQFRSLVEGTSSVPWQWNPSTVRFTFVGPQGAQLLGCSVDDWLHPDFWRERIHPDDLPRVTEHW